MSRATCGVLSRRLLILLLFAQATTAANDGITIESAWIEMPDGVRLAADLYKPSDLKPGDKLPCCLSTPRTEKQIPGPEIFPCIPISLSATTS